MEITRQNPAVLLNLCVTLLLFRAPCTHCQDGTTQAAVQSTPASSQSSPVQPTAAVVPDNTTKATTSTSNSTLSPTTLTQASDNATTMGPTSNISSTLSSSANASMPASANSTTVSETESPDETDMPTDNPVTENSTGTHPAEEETSAQPTYYELCPSGVPCDQLGADCLNCSLDSSCVYGREYNTTCTLKDGLDCIGSLPVEKTYQCRYCYQTETWQQSCTPANNCQVNACPKEYPRVNCTVNEDVLCLGFRNFHRKKPCNWTSGYKWTTALILSVTLGGFGADRFYLGYWQSGLGKLFSFGGAGVWTLIDVLLIAVGYITPSDGSHYIY